MKSLLSIFLFGRRAQGVKLTPPTLRTLEVQNRPTENQWAEHVKFGSRYGHRGSFYQRN